MDQHPHVPKEWFSITCGWEVSSSAELCTVLRERDGFPFVAGLHARQQDANRRHQEEEKGGATSNFTLEMWPWLLAVRYHVASREGQHQGRCREVLAMTTARAATALMFASLIAGSVAAQDPPAVTQVIAAATGGGITAPSGRMVLTIPAGALQADTEVTVTELPPEEGPAIGFTYDLQPDGLEFQQPATITVSYSPDEVPEGFEPEDVAIVRLGPVKDGDMQEVPATDPTAIDLDAGWGYLETSVDPEVGTASAEIEHFSRYGTRAYATYRLRDRDNRWLPGICDAGDKSVVAVGTGSASANYDLGGMLSSKLAVPMGTVGGATTRAVLTKVFRVKPAADGTRSTREGVVYVVVDHRGIMDADTNHYSVWITIACHDGRRMMGKPEVMLPLEGPAGQFNMIGMFMQAFYADPLFGHMNRYPLGPSYHWQELEVAFGECRLVAGRFYYIMVALNASITGNEPEPAFGTPPRGGELEWEWVLGHPFHIQGISVDVEG